MTFQGGAFYFLFYVKADKTSQIRNSVKTPYEIFQNLFYVMWNSYAINLHSFIILKG